MPNYINMIRCHIIPTLKAEIEVQSPEYVALTVVQSCTADIRATPHIVQGEA